MISCFFGDRRFAYPFFIGALLKCQFGETSKTPYDLADLVVDVHSHLIPGIDDGAQTMDQTIGMLLKFKELGIKKLVTTPHIMSDLYTNTTDIIRKGLSDVRDKIEEYQLDI